MPLSSTYRRLEVSPATALALPVEVRLFSSSEIIVRGGVGL